MRALKQAPIDLGLAAMLQLKVRLRAGENHEKSYGCKAGRADKAARRRFRGFQQLDRQLLLVANLGPSFAAGAADAFLAEPAPACELFCDGCCAVLKLTKEKPRVIRQTMTLRGICGCSSLSDA